MTHSAGQMQHPYPAQLSIAYPESSNRLTVLFRLILALPIIVIAGLVGGGFSSGDANADGWITPLAAGGALWLAPMLMILFRREYPRWWFDWNLGLSRFMARVTAYLLLLRDDYPATDDLQAVTLEIAYPDVERHLSRFLPLVKWLLALPHYVVLSFLAVATVIVTVIAWFAVLAGGAVSAGAVPIRRGDPALGRTGRGLRVHVCHRRIPTVSAQPVAGAAGAAPTIQEGERQQAGRSSPPAARSWRAR